MPIRAARASGVSGSGWPSSASARAARLSSAASSRRCRVRTRARERSAALSSKDGFSVVAPTSTMVPSSISGRKASCWARLKRWISSTKSSVPRPLLRRRRAASKIFLRSATPVKMALIWTKARSVASASRRAMVVLPTPGGPQKTIEPRLPSASIRAERAVGAEQVVLADDLLEPRAGAAGRRAGAARRRAGAARRPGGGRRGRPWRNRVARPGADAKARVRTCDVTRDIPLSNCKSDVGPALTAVNGVTGAQRAHSTAAASSAATRALSPAPLAAGSRSTSSMIAIGAMSP